MLQWICSSFYDLDYFINYFKLRLLIIVKCLDLVNPPRGGGVEIKLIFALQAAVSEDTGRLSKLPYLGMESGIWQKFQKLHMDPLPTPGGGTSGASTSLVDNPLNKKVSEVFLLNNRRQKNYTHSAQSEASYINISITFNKNL